ncbi:MAG: hypothetical protein J6E29_07015 [Prevotella sp.]|nr:hypothetical protein [Prevotella sp.]
MKKYIILIALLSLFLCETWGQFGYNPYRQRRPNTNDVFLSVLNGVSQGLANKNKYSRNSIRRAINEWEQCKTGTLSLEYGAVAIYGSNGYRATTTVDDDISTMLKSIHSRSMTIDDINILENGNYIVVYNSGRSVWGKFPNHIENAINKINDGKIFSAALSEDNYYFVVTENSLYTNSQVAAKFYNEQKEMMGQLYSVSTCGMGTNQGVIFCFEKGTCFFGYIPKNVAEAMDDYSGTVCFVKYNIRGDFLICSKAGGYSYHIVDVDKSTLAAMTYKAPPSLYTPATQGGGMVTPYPQESYSDTENGGQTPVTTSHTCRICGGSGSTVSEPWLGNTNSTKYCDICRKEVYVAHHHTPCSTCGGNGVISY